MSLGDYDLLTEQNKQRVVRWVGGLPCADPLTIGATIYPDGVLVIAMGQAPDENAPRPLRALCFLRPEAESMPEDTP